MRTTEKVKTARGLMVGAENGKVYAFRHDELCW